MPSKPDRHVQGRALLGRAIRDRRTALGLTLAEVSVKSGLSPFTINSYEHGRRLPSLEALDAVATALGLSARELLRDVYPWDDVSAPTAD